MRVGGDSGWCGPTAGLRGFENPTVATATAGMARDDGGAGGIEGVFRGPVVSYATDTSVGTWSTNYLVGVMAGVLGLWVLGTARLGRKAEALKEEEEEEVEEEEGASTRRSVRRALGLHLVFFAASYLAAGTVHHLYYHEQCPGTRRVWAGPLAGDYGDVADAACPEGAHEAFQFAWGPAMGLQALGAGFLAEPLAGLAGVVRWAGDGGGGGGGALERILPSNIWGLKGNECLL